jgi:hypothetical protein
MLMSTTTTAPTTSAASIAAAHCDKYLSSTALMTAMKAGEITFEECCAAVEVLSQRNAAAAAKAATPPPAALYAKVSEKGAISVYGLQRMPVTLYLEQWERLLKFSPSLVEFINESLVSGKVRRETAAEKQARKQAAAAAAK